MRTFEEVRALLADKFKKEKLRLKTYGTKADSFQLANVTARFVLALMAESRYKELKKLRKLALAGRFGINSPVQAVCKYLDERVGATKNMSRAIRHMAEDADSKRPWNSSNERDHDKRRSRKSRRNS